MTAAHDSRAEAMKEAAVLRSLAEAVASPVVAGHKSHRPLTDEEKKDWNKIVDVVCDNEASCGYRLTLEGFDANKLAEQWKDRAKAKRIGYTKPLPIVGFVFPIPGFWVLFFKLLIQLAIMYIESRNQQGRVSDR